LQQKVSKKIKLPPGYYITYGGQYENLQRASKRLSIAVPIALLLILVMLYFAFNKLKYCLLIFSAIPLSAIGGVFALWTRGMPFSISAGVGFIALFGVAVLNGIVLIGEMNRLRHDGVKNLMQVIMQATQVRLRPVMMTAAVASLGFLPMAISNGAGAEVQRPLATVVIGGLVSATILTLLMLPALYLLFERKKKPKPNMKNIITTVVVLFISINIFAQDNGNNKMHLQQVIMLAEKNAELLKLGSLEEKYFYKLKATATELPKTQIGAELGNYNSTFYDSRITITQGFAASGYYKKQKNLLEAYFQSARSQSEIKKADIKKLAEQLYIQLQFLQARKMLLKKTDSIYTKYVKVARVRFEKGESNLLEKTTLENQSAQNNLQLQATENDLIAVQLQLAVLLQTDAKIEAADAFTAERKLFDTALLHRHPVLKYYRQQQQQSLAQTAVEKSKLNPDFFVGYNNQSVMGWQLSKDRIENYYDAGRRFSSVSLGINVPIFAKAQKAKIEASQVNEQISNTSYKLMQDKLQSDLYKALQDYDKYCTTALYYQNQGTKQSDLIIATANLNYQNGQINYLEWVTLFNQALQIQSEFINAMHQQRLAESELNYLLLNN